MSLARLLSGAFILLVPMWTAVAYPPAPVFRQSAEILPVGKWTVEFANGVVETCEMSKNGSLSVTEPNRTSTGKPEAKDGAVVIAFEDDRLERWTVVGKRMVVEHWYPASQYPSGARVLGIGNRSP